MLDSLSEMRILAQEPLRFRRQMLALKQFFAAATARVLLLDDKRSRGATSSFTSLVHGVMVLEQLALEYGAERRRRR